MTNNKIWVASPLSFHSELKTFATEQQAIKYSESHTDQMFVISDKKLFNSLVKQAQASFIQTPKNWAFRRLDRALIKPF